MRTKKDNIQNRDSLSKLIQRFDGLENNNPPTNPIDDKKTGILYTSDWIDKLSYPEPGYFENRYQEPLKSLDKLPRTGEWVYDIVLTYRNGFPVVPPDYGYNLIHTNDFFTIKKVKDMFDICLGWTSAENTCRVAELDAYITWNDPPGFGTIEILFVGITPPPLGYEISSDLFTATTTSVAPFFVNTSTTGSVAGTHIVTVVDINGNPVSWDTNMDDNIDAGVCFRDPYAIYVGNPGDQVYLPNVGDMVTSFDALCLIDAVGPFEVSYVNVVENFFYLVAGGETVYIPEGCEGTICYQTENPRNLLNNDVRGYVKDITVGPYKECYKFTSKVNDPKVNRFVGDNYWNAIGSPGITVLTAVDLSLYINDYFYSSILPVPPTPATTLINPNWRIATAISGGPGVWVITVKDWQGNVYSATPSDWGSTAIEFLLREEPIGSFTISIPPGIEIPTPSLGNTIISHPCLSSEELSGVTVSSVSCGINEFGFNECLIEFNWNLIYPVLLGNCSGTVCFDLTQDEINDTIRKRLKLICVITEGDPYKVNVNDMFIWSRDEFRTDTNPRLEEPINLEALRVLTATADLTWIDPTRLGKSFVIRIRKDGSNETGDIYYSDTLGLNVTTSQYTINFLTWGLTSGDYRWSVCTIFDDEKKYFSMWSEESLLIIR